MDRLIRQRDIIPERVLTTPITIVGAGAIGSHTAKALAQMGFSCIAVYDDDRVSEENLNSQGYCIGDIGEKKVEALEAMCRAYSGVVIDSIPSRYIEESPPIHSGILITAVDSMESRRLIWEKNKGAPFLALIDPRMSAEQALLYVMQPRVPYDQEAYERTLHSDEEGIQEPCTAKATIYTALLLSGMVCKAVKDILTTGRYPRVVHWNIRENAVELFNETREFRV